MSRLQPGERALLRRERPPAARHPEGRVGLRRLRRVGLDLRHAQHRRRRRSPGSTSRCRRGVYYGQPLVDAVAGGDGRRGDDRRRRAPHPARQALLPARHRSARARPDAWSRAPAHRALALEVARKAIVLLKNDGGALPLDRAAARLDRRRRRARGDRRTSATPAAATSRRRTPSRRSTASRAAPAASTVTHVAVDAAVAERPGDDRRRRRRRRRRRPHLRRRGRGPGHARRPRLARPARAQDAARSPPSRPPTRAPSSCSRAAARSLDAVDRRRRGDPHGLVSRAARAATRSPTCCSAT